MRVVIAGGHGQIALRLTTLLAGRGDVVTGVVRNPDHRGDVEAAGATALVLDLEAVTATDLAEHLVGADAVVFAATAADVRHVMVDGTWTVRDGVHARLPDTARELDSAIKALL